MSAQHILSTVASEQDQPLTGSLASESLLPANHALKHTRKTVKSASRNPQPKETKTILPCMGVQNDIMEAAYELAFEDDGREISAVLARRFGFSESVIDRIICRHSYAHRKAYHAQRNGILNSQVIAHSVLRKTLEA